MVDQELAEVRQQLTSRDETIATMQKVIFDKDTEIAVLNSRIQRLRTDLAQHQQATNSGTLMVQAEKRTGRPGQRTR